VSMYRCDRCDTFHDNDWSPCEVVFGGLGNPMPMYCEDCHITMYPSDTIVGTTHPGSMDYFRRSGGANEATSEET